MIYSDTVVADDCIGVVLSNKEEFYSQFYSPFIFLLCIFFGIDERVILLKVFMISLPDKFTDMIDTIGDKKSSKNINRIMEMS